MAMLSGVNVPPAVPAPTADYGEVAKTVQGIMKWSKLPQSVGAGVGRLVKQAGVDTTMQNALRDGAEWAWVPQGDTCAFCIMLASNGWQKASRKALKNGHAEHIHSNCDCTYAVRFNEKTTVAGYDPDYYKAIYDNAEGDNWREKLASIRRDQYERDKSTVDGSQKRDTMNLGKGLGDKKLRIPQIPASIISKKVESGEYSLKLFQQEYDKHIEGTSTYENYRQSRERKGLAPQSVLTISKAEAQLIINKYSGTGIIKPRRDGSPTNIEKISCDYIIGYYYNKGIKVYTTKAAIHHGSKGSHLVPIKGNDYD